MNEELAQVTEQLEGLVSEWLTQPDFADRLGTSPKSVRSALADERIVGVKRGNPKVLGIPAEFLIPSHMANPADIQHDDGSGKLVILPSLRGTIITLRDSQLSDAEILVWLFSQNDYLGQRPIDALHQGNKSSVRRAAQQVF